MDRDHAMKIKRYIKAKCLDCGDIIELYSLIRELSFVILGFTKCNHCNAKVYYKDIID
jgi:hypothetical protein